jgi:DNA mismatch repair protein MutS2
VSSDNKSFESVIEQLENSRVQMEKEREEAKRLREEYERFKAEAERQLRRKLESAEKEAEAARKKAAAMVQSAKASCDFLYEQMDKMRKAQEAANAAAELDKARRAVRDHLRTTGDLFDPIEVQEEDEGYVLPRPLKKGDKVRIVTIHKEGVVTEDPKGNLVAVQAGVVRTKARIEDLRLIDEDERGQKKKPAQPAVKSSVSVERSNQFKDEIDLRGMIGDEAWLAVDKYLDDAIMYNVKVVHLIHGKGTGALKNALWKFLRGDKRIASFRIGRYGEGDGGVTVVELK